MQADYDLLPSRPRNQVSRFQSATKAQFITNYFSIRMLNKKASFSQYSITTTPELPADSLQQLYRIIKSLRNKLREKFGYICSRGNMLWGEQSLEVHPTFQTTIDGTTYQVLLKETKKLSFLNFDKPQDQLALLQILNIKQKEMLKNMNMVELGLGKFYNKDAFKNNFLKDVGLQVVRGYKFTLAPLPKGICLLVDVCSRVLRTENLLQSMNSSTKDQILDNFVGSTIISRYGNYKTYKIEDFDFYQSPQSEFYSQKVAGKMTYKQYFMNSYGIKIINNKQPLVVAIGHIQKKRNKDGTMEETPHMVRLIPQLMSLTGMSDKQKRNYNTMKALGPLTKLDPSQRMKQSQRFKENLNTGNNSSIQIQQAIKMPGFILRQPQVIIQNQTIRAEGGNINFRDKVRNPGNFKDWVFVYSRGIDPKNDDNDADKAVNLLQTARKVYGIKLQKPAFIVVQGNNFKSEIKKDIELNGIPQIIVVFLNQDEEKLYSQLKKFLTNQMKAPSQFIRKRTFSQKAKNSLSLASKIILQMNVKIGCPIWEIPQKHPYFKKKKFMYGALSLSKGKRGFTLAFVGTINSQCTEMFCYSKYNIKKKEEIPAEIFLTLFKEWARQYYKNNKAIPQIILVYREGLTDAQAKQQLRPQIDAVRNAVNVMAEKTKTANYKPQIVYIIAQKKVNTRFYTKQLRNPEPGSVIVEDLSKNGSFDFHLAAQRVTQGTCTPTYYRVAYIDSPMPIQAMVQFTHEQCYNYYNWSGAVRVPACLQCAGKLAKLVGEYISEDIKENPLQTKQFFL